MVAAHLGLGPRSITDAIQEYHPALLQVQCSVIGGDPPRGSDPGCPTHPPPSLFKGCWAGGLALTRRRDDIGTWYVSPA